jgi:sigma-54 dependent transcriptional regulator, acetoin dehydrogenase operon transcriptional activator AcoR
MNFSELICTKILENKLSQNLTIISEQLKSIIDTMNEGIIGIDGQGQISFMNSYAKRKIDPEIEHAMLGRKIHEFLPQITLERLSSFSKSDYYESGFLEINNNPVQIIYSLATIQIPNVKGGAIIAYRLSNDASKLIKNISEVTRTVSFNDVFGISPIFQRTKLLASRAAENDSTVLLLGESGTGKEQLARAIHSSGERRHKPFIAINCAAIPDNLVESELFGYERGAFTGASTAGKPGNSNLQMGEPYY